MSEGRMMDPELAAAITRLDKAGQLDMADLHGARGLARKLSSIRRHRSPHVRQASFEERVLPVGEKGATVRVRITRPGSVEGLLPGLLWMHGGGLVLGLAEQDDPVMAELVSEIACVVVSVEYRLAPEHPYPAAIDDCFGAYLWLCDHSAELGVDATRIGVGGASAGGGLAAAIALMARDHGAPAPLFQVLTYPMLDDRCDTPSQRELPEIGIWDAGSNREAWAAALRGVPYPPPCYAAPARAADLSNLPPAFIAVGELDLFRDESLAFANRLVEARVPTEYHLYPGAYHSFDIMAPDSRITQSYKFAWKAYLARMWGQQTPWPSHKMVLCQV